MDDLGLFADVRYLAIFTARQHSLLLQSAVLAIVNPSVRPSVCPSVTHWHCVNMNHATIT